MHEFNPELTYGIVSAHPDDHIPHAHFLETANQFDTIVHELVHTKGRNGIDLTGTGGVADGLREREGIRSSRSIGINRYQQLDGDDGRLSGSERRIAETTAHWAIEHEIDVLVTLGTEDHADHDAIVRASRIAARILVAESLDASVMELKPAGYRPENDLSIAFESSQNSLTRAFGAAANNPSQFTVTAGIANDWPLVGGYSIEPSSYRRLVQYPLLSDATYQVIDSEQLRDSGSLRYTSDNYEDLRYAAL